VNSDIVARVIPCLDVTNGRVVKGVNFVDLRDAGDPVELAARYDLHKVLTSLCFLTSQHLLMVAKPWLMWCLALRNKCSFPFTVGGGIREVADARKMLRAGADKVSVNTAAVQRP
jgi:imidazole glycerol-phosphate synthase subunit HisF